MDAGTVKEVKDGLGTEFYGQKLAGKQHFERGILGVTWLGDAESTEVGRMCHLGNCLCLDTMGSELN